MADAKTLISKFDGVLVRAAGRLHRVDKGGAVPANADADHVQVLRDRGLVADGEPAAGFVADPDAPPPFTVDDPDAPPPFTVDDPDGPGPIPAKSANKDAWVAYAVSQGADQAEAEAATKDDLIARYGG